MRRIHRAVAPWTLLALLLLSFAGFAAATSSAPPTGEEIINRFIEVTGGKDAYARLNSRVSTGTISIAQPPMSGTIMIYQKAPNLIRVTGSVGPVTFDRGYNGTVGYEINSAIGTRLIDGDERDLMEQQSLTSPLANLGKSFTNVENVGTEEIDGRDAYKVELTMKSGEKIAEWFDTESGLLVRADMSMDSAGGKLQIIATSSDWQEIDGLKVPMKSTQKIEPFGIEQTIEFTKIENNADVPAEKFELPDEIKDLMKDGAAATQPSTQPSSGAKKN